jgi:magnesium transporter
MELEHRVKGELIEAFDSDEEQEQDSQGDDDKKWTEATDLADLPFDLRASDSILHVVFSLLTQDAYELQESALQCVHEISSVNSGVPDEALHAIRRVKDSLNEMTSRIRMFVDSLHLLLDNDEDMSLMQLSFTTSSVAQRDEIEEVTDVVESILESHMQTGLTLLNAMTLVQGQVATASELVDLNLDAMRNRILFVEVLINLTLLAFSMGIMATGFLSVNLRFGLRNKPNALGPVACITTFFTVAFIVLGYFYCRRLAPWTVSRAKGK